jgi:hypothetical protein
LSVAVTDIGTLIAPAAAATNNKQQTEKWNAITNVGLWQRCTKGNQEEGGNTWFEINS